MNRTKEDNVSTDVLIRNIVEGIQEKKGHCIKVLDLRDVNPHPAPFFVIAEGTSNTQVCAIADEVEDYVRKNTKEKPVRVFGLDNAEWVAMDYSDVLVHIFQRSAREFYDIESLWADGKITDIPEI